MPKLTVPKLKESSNYENFEVVSNPVNGMRKTMHVNDLWEDNLESRHYSSINEYAISHCYEKIVVFDQIMGSW